MTDQKQILQSYRDIISMIKSNVIRDLIEAGAMDKFSVDRTTLETLTTLIDTLVDVYAANGYEALMNQTNSLNKTTKTKKR